MLTFHFPWVLMKQFALFITIQIFTVSKESQHSSVVFLSLQTHTCVWGNLWFLLGKNIQQDKLGILCLE